ncbi:helix-turn-helix transcriptional regulator [Spirosoma aureum]|uniref:Helix-turn-helix transcriptional regulator n=1 Tax=Spirosoma aureum TaxID=2692134 RepID=A0A6G9ASN1_9BACT|nr:helix-turn-helix transcriptional regulator [Spirosoma aureum]QIP15481.1 helix-turn-helix transcriptional regulator [Spirosoma aureum]
MKTEQFLPIDRLKPFIKTFLIIESENGMVNRILPGTSIVMAFKIKGSVSYAEKGIETSLSVSTITGLRKSHRLLDYSKETATLLVIFQEGGAAVLFKEPLHELFGLSVALDDLIPRSTVDELEERLAEAVSNRHRITIIEQFLLARVQEPVADKLVDTAINEIKRAHGVIRIKDLITNLPISRDPFEKRFRRVIGTSPKQFSSIIRLRSLIADHSEQENLTEAAYLAGYFDQAHFIKDFKSFTGQTPHHFFAAGPYW